MTNAGWYPDPAGAPDTYRYWDGQAWSQMTTSQPPAGGPAQPSGPPQQPQQPQQPQPPQAGQPPQYGAVPPPPSSGGGYGGPGAPGGYGQPAWAPQPGGSGGGGGGKTIAIVVAGVLALVLIGVAGFFGVRALTGDDDKSADDDSSQTPTDGSSATDGSGSPTDGSGSPTDGGSSSTVMPSGIQCTGGNPTPSDDPGTSPRTVSGGGLTIPRPQGFAVDLNFSDPFSFADSITVAYASVTENWVSLYAVGAVPKANGFTSTDQAAEIIMQCLTMNDRVYNGFDSRTDLENESVTVDGASGHLITSEIRVDDPQVTLEGDVTTVVVLDTGDDESYGVFIGVAPIGDDERIAQSERVLDKLAVD